MGDIALCLIMPRKPLTGDLTLVRKAFGKTISELREQSGLAQEHLAFESDVDRRFMSGLERGQHSPTLDTVMKLLWRLEVSFVDFAIVFERELKKLKRNRVKT